LKTSFPYEFTLYNTALAPVIGLLAVNFCLEELVLLAIQPALEEPSHAEVNLPLCRFVLDGFASSCCCIVNCLVIPEFTSIKRRSVIPTSPSITRVELV
jgi:hypothetical protein